MGLGFATVLLILWSPQIFVWLSKVYLGYDEGRRGHHISGDKWYYRQGPVGVALDIA